MPNTLAHLGVAGIATRSIFRNADLRWIYLGAIIPDLPWILQRIVRFVSTSLDIFDLRLYAIVQATFFFSLILSGFFSLISTAPLKNFMVMGFGAFLHLFLDAIQIKWANGVHFLAPFNWQLTQFGYFWPDSIPTYLITGAGAVYFVLNWRKSMNQPWSVIIKSKSRLYGAGAVLGLYFVLPFLFLSMPEASNNHFVKTLREVEARPGKPIEFDRAVYQYEAPNGKLHSFHGEVFELVNFTLDYSTLLSIRGEFIDQHTIQVNAHNVHSSYFRDNASYLGLFLVAYLWGQSGFLAFRKKRQQIRVE